MSNVTPVTVAYGDGIVPEIMAASRHAENLRTYDGKLVYTLAQGH
ncbi:MAG: hypothetical protein ABSB86_05730 [Bryobacteraceae bacterium]|jgi:hypothetical protein